jgi:hypothetical protein
MGLQLSGSVQLEGNLLVTGSANSVFENILVSGKLTTQEIETQLVSSSIIYSSGSNKFGDLVTDTQQFTGSVNLSGSLIINGNVAIGTPYADESFTINGYSNGTSRLRLFNQGTLIGALGSYLGIVGFGGANDLLLLAPNDLVFGGGNAEKARLSGNNLLMGVTSSVWWTNSTAIQLPQFASLSHQNNASLNLMSFALETSANTFTYAETGAFPLRYNQNPNNGTHTWFTAPVGTAGDTINFTSSMSLTTAGAATFSNSVTVGTQLNIANVGGKFAGEGGVTNYLGIYKDDSTPILRAVSNSAGASDVIVSTGNLVIGTAGKGIDFSATSELGGMTSELLNDYEEGTWSPTPTSTGATFDTAVNGSYTKIGRLVYIRCQLDNASAPTGTLSNPMTITNLPFTAAAGSGYGASLAVGFEVGIAYPAGAIGIQARVLAGTTSIELRFTQNDASGDDFLASNFDGSDARIALSGCYEV